MPRSIILILSAIRRLISSGARLKTSAKCCSIRVRFSRWGVFPRAALRVNARLMAAGVNKQRLIEQFALEVLETAHDANHLNGGARCFEAAIVFLAETANAGLLFILE
jgi:hypothetical protein